MTDATASGNDATFDSNQSFIRGQYADSRAFRVRVDTHRKYGTRKQDTFGEWLLAQVDAPEGSLIADIGCGPGLYHPPLARTGARIVAIDMSPGMVREACDQAAAGGFAIDGIVASAEQLPLRDGLFDRVMANHMLYHVPDQLAALREMRRIARPGGRVVLSTNAASNMQRLHEVHVNVARNLGFEATPLTPLRFSLDDVALVRSVFPDAEVRVRGNALIFPDADGPTRYYGSYFVNSIEDRPADGSHRKPLLDAFRAEMEALIAGEGPVRVPCDAGCFVATKNDG
jgi:SAM-dependent methyltransferase